VPERVVGYILGEFPSLTETFILREMRELRRQGIMLRLFSLRRGDCLTSPLPPELDNVEIHYAPSKSTARFWASALRWALNKESCRPVVAAAVHNWLRVLRAHPEVCHLHAHFANEPALAARELSRATGIPFSFSAHAWDIYCSGSPLRQLIAEASFVTTCTRTNLDHLLTLCAAADRDSVHLMRHGIDLQEFEFAQRPSSRPFRCVAIGRLVRKKGFNLLVEALADLRNRNFDVQCEIIGDGPERASLQKLITRRGVQDHVFLVGPLRHGDAMEKLRQADALIVPSVITAEGDRDGLPNVLLEAAACGVPIVASALPAIREFVSDGVTGLLAPVGDVAKLAHCLERLIKDDGRLVQNLRRNARRLVEEEFDITKNVAPLVELFHSQGA